ncbi:MAG: T9SS C-terminal target domain-containing protein, partial [Candidatus Latescibacterota bacterium]
FDVDIEGDLDYFVAGAYYVPDGGGLVEARTQLFRNDASAGNAAPSEPSGIQAVAAGPDGVTLSWGSSTDDHTPEAALTYEVEVMPIGARPAPAENGLPVFPIGARALPEPGNVSRNETWTLRGLADGDYLWSVRAVDNAFNGGSIAQGTFSIGTVGIGSATGGPRSLVSWAPHPNPSRVPAQFTLLVDREQGVEIAVYDVSGRRVASLHDGPLGAGAHTFSLDGAGLSSGAYFLRATGSGQTVVRRMTLLR